jgi:DNA-binding GntR family transcriptional regulator
VETKGVVSVTRYGGDIASTSDSGAQRGRGLRSIGNADSAVDRVTAEIRRAVLTGALAPGASFSISDLSTQLGVSHIPVREALRQLHSQGLIVMRPGRSAIVSPLNRLEFQSIYRLRLLIEPDLAARSIPFTEDALTFMDELLAVYCQEEGASDQFWDSHHELHVELIRPAASEWDLRVLEQLWHASDRYTRVVFDALVMTPAEREERHVRHRDLLVAARSGSSKALRQAVQAHLRDNEAACLARITSLTALDDELGAESTA